ncbi:MAG: hypothetical protein ACLRYF_05025 [Mediterraneibacter faecis]
MSMVLCPTLLFIEDEDWENKDKKDKFLDNLTLLFDYINENNVTIYWNNELDQALWKTPLLHPWLSQDTTDITMHLWEYVVYMNNEMKSTCNCTPDIINNISTKDILSPTLFLIHDLLNKGETFIFVVDEVNNHKFVFNCNCHSSIIEPDILYLFDKTINISDEILQKWTLIKNNNSVLNDILEMVRKKYFSDKNILYNIEYDKTFIKDIEKVKNREQIIYAIVKRVIQTQKEAMRDKSLKDEPLIGSKNKRRFRVNISERIHYTYGNDTTIRLLSFGDHDYKL